MTRQYKPPFVYNPRGHVETNPHLAIERNSFTWPTHWRKVIYKIDRHYDVVNAATLFRVIPRNPEYAAYLEGESIDMNIPIPRPYLDTVEFETLEDMDKWARICARLDN